MHGLDYFSPTVLHNIFVSFTGEKACTRLHYMQVGKLSEGAFPKPCQHLSMSFKQKTSVFEVSHAMFHARAS